MSKRIYNIVRPREGKDGKTFWDRHGAMIVDGDKISIHLDSIPAGEWNGWFNVYPKDDSRDGGGRAVSGTAAEDAEAQPRRATSPDDYRKATGRANAPVPAGDFDDDIPF